MRQSWYGFILFMILVLPPVRDLLESIMAFHMHMQMMLLFISGILMAPFFRKYFGRLLEKYNETGIPGAVLFLVILMYWMLPRAMDEALELWHIEMFKFISLPFLAGVPLRDSWRKIGQAGQSIVYLFVSVVFSIMAYLYIFSESTLCNNYLMTDQKTVGWGFAFFAGCLLMYLVLTVFTDQSQYFESGE